MDDEAPLLLPLALRRPRHLDVETVVTTEIGTRDFEIGTSRAPGLLLASTKISDDPVPIADSLDVLLSRQHDLVCRVIWAASENHRVDFEDFLTRQVATLTSS